MLRLLRGQMAGEAAAALADLAERARAEGLTIEAAGVRFLSEDEHLLLAWLAARQRPTLEFTLEARRVPALEAAIAACAQRLLSAGLRLPPPPATLFRARRTGGAEG